MKKNLSIILAGGSGERFKGELPKQFLKLSGKTIIEHTVEAFEVHPKIDEIYVVINPSYYDYMLELAERRAFRKLKKILKGGKTRQESSYIGLKAASELEFENVLIHDAVRPFVSQKMIDDVLEALLKYDAVDTAIPSPDTIIKINDDSFIEEIPNRKYLRRGQTPQGFKLSIIKKAHKLAMEENFKGATDDCSLVLRYSLSPVYVVEGSNNNIKITYPIDIYIADKIFQVKTEGLKSKEKSELKKLAKGKVFVVFGGTSGIGKKVCELLEEFGAKPYPASRRTGVDVTNYVGVEEFLRSVYEREKRIDSVIISSGILELGFVEAVDIEHIRRIFETNYIGSVYVSKASIKYLKKTKGSIVFFTSSSYTRGRAGYSIYSSSKSAIVNYAQALSDELAKYSIKVNIINPERTKTPMREKAFGKEDESTLLSAEFVAFHTINVALSEYTGHVFDIRVKDEKG